MSGTVKPAPGLLIHCRESKQTFFLISVGLLTHPGPFHSYEMIVLEKSRVRFLSVERSHYYAAYDVIA